MTNKDILLLHKIDILPDHFVSAYEKLNGKNPIPILRRQLWMTSLFATIAVASFVLASILTIELVHAHTYWKNSTHIGMIFFFVMMCATAITVVDNTASPHPFTRYLNKLHDNVFCHFGYDWLSLFSKSRKDLSSDITDRLNYLATIVKYCELEYGRDSKQQLLAKIAFDDLYRYSVLTGLADPNKNKYFDNDIVMEILQKDKDALKKSARLMRPLNRF